MSRAMSALVIGYGSIGARHARLLQALGCATGVVSARSIDFPNVFPRIDSALALWQPEYVVIANATCQHLDTLRSLATLGYAGRVLVEKPLFGGVAPPPDQQFERLAVAYNLRFHPAIDRLRKLLDGEKVLSVQCYVGQYLPNWRPGADYRLSYSSHAAQGGGVLRDLSHELDYLQFIFGEWLRVSAIGGHFSHLEGDSDDIFGLMMSCTSCPLVQVQLNYMDRVGRRSILVNTDSHTIVADLVANTLTVDACEEFISIERDFTYQAMHRAMLDDERADVRLCSLSEGMDTMRLITAAEAASHSSQWQLNRNL